MQNTYIPGNRRSAIRIFGETLTGRLYCVDKSLGQLCAGVFGVVIDGLVKLKLCSLEKDGFHAV